MAYKGEDFPIVQLRKGTEIGVPLAVEFPSKAVARVYKGLPNTAESKILVIDNIQFGGTYEHPNTGVTVYGSEYGIKTKQWTETVIETLDNVTVRKLTGKIGGNLVTIRAKAMIKNGLLDTMMGNPIGVRLGSDPEVFVLDEKDTVIPAPLFLPAKNPNNTTGMMQVFWDGVQAEMQLNAFNCLQELTQAVRRGLGSILTEARKKHPKAHLTIKNVVEVPQNWLQTCPNHHAQLGCAPSLNIYGLQGDFPPDGRLLPVRSAAVHMHFGVSPNYKLPRQVSEIVKCLDCTAGLASVSLAEKYDHPIRRRYYGLPGEHRLPSHGIEYRVPSTILLSHPAIHHLVWDFARIGVNMGMRNLRAALPITDQEVVEAIRESDATKARELLNKCKDIFTPLIRGNYNRTLSSDYLYRYPYVVSTAWDALTNGVEKTVAKPDAVEENWCLNNLANQARNRQWSEAALVVNGKQQLL